MCLILILRVGRAKDLDVDSIMEVSVLKLFDNHGITFDNLNQRDDELNLKK